MFKKIMDKTVALRLAKRGFSYMTETVNKDTVYVFEATAELEAALNEKFADGAAIEDNSLRF